MEQWLKLSVQVAEPGDITPAQLKQELALLSDIIQKDSVLAHLNRSCEANQPNFKTRWTIFRSGGDYCFSNAPARSAAWLPRLFFYVGLACALIIPLGLSAPQDPLTPKDLLVSELFFLVWIVIFRSLSHWLEQPRHAIIDREIQVSPPPKPL